MCAFLLQPHDFLWWPVFRFPPCITLVLPQSHLHTQDRDLLTNLPVLLEGYLTWCEKPTTTNIPNLLPVRSILVKRPSSELVQYRSQYQSNHHLYSIQTLQRYGRSHLRSSPRARSLAHKALEKYEPLHREALVP